MKNISEIVKKTAELARLDLSSAELDMFSQQIGSVLGYIEKLQAVDTDGVAELITPLAGGPGGAAEEAGLRPDEAREGGGAALVGAAFEHLYGNYKVPQVIAGKS